MVSKGSMGQYRKTFRFEASIEQLWELMSDPDRLPEWNGAFDRVENVTGPLDEVGTTYTQVMRVAGIELKGDWEVTEVDPPRSRRFRGTPPGCAVCIGSETFEEVEGGTEYTVEMDYTLRGGPVGKAIDRLFGRSLFRRIVERNVRELRQILER